MQQQNLKVYKIATKMFYFTRILLNPLQVLKANKKCGI